MRRLGLAQASLSEKPLSEIEKARKVFEVIKKEEMKSLADAGFGLFEDFGKFLVAIGTLQKTNKEAYEFVMKIGENPQPFLAMLIEYMPEEGVKKLVQAMLEIFGMMSETKNLEDMDADTKVKIGEKIIALVSELKSTNKGE
jgi:hypothetical protein